MSTYPSDVWEPSSDRHTGTGALYSDAARDHLWMHFTRHSTFEDHGLGHSVPIITKGQGWTIWDDRGNEYIDALAGLFVTNVGLSASASLRRLLEDPNPPDHCVLVTEQDRAPLTVGAWNP